MITTRTRILSILATVAMLVSMLTCFVIPASAAAETSDYVEVWNDIASGADNLSALINADGLIDPSTTVDALKLAAETDAATIVWKEFVWDSEPFPRYALKEAYDAAGYTTKEYSISAPADWTAMVDASVYDATNSPNPETFAGYTFHVTNNVDFAGVASESNPMYPLNLGTGVYYASDYSFQGTIKGHNHAFKNIYVTDPLTTTTGNRLIGLIGKLGNGAVIENFGVDSGKIVTSTTCSRSSASTFGVGCPASAENLAVLHNVWSGVDITVSGGSKGNFAGGILGICADNYGGATVNGAYFDGTLTAATQYGILYNLKFGKVYNALSNPETATYAISLQSSATSSQFKNIYGVGNAPVNTNATVTEENITENNCVKTTSAKIGAWEINKANVTAAAADGVEKVYYTWVTNSLNEKAIRPTGDATNRIVKVIVDANTDNPLYVNLNTTELDKEALCIAAGITEAADQAKIAGYTVDGGDEQTFGSDPISLPATENVTDNTVAIALTQNVAGELTDLRNQWNQFNVDNGKYLTDTSVEKLQAFIDAADTALATPETSDDSEFLSGNHVTELEENLVTYSTYPAEDGKAVPGYKEVGVLGAYNTANVWTINSTEDWLKMVADSNAETAETPNTFRGYKFYVTDNIDFSTVTEPMAPLNYSTGAQDNTTCPFQGTIEGNGYAFRNVNVLFETDDEEGKTYVAGLIGKLGIRAQIKNFGVDSGSIKGTGTSNNVFVSTFGEPLHTNGGQNAREDGEKLADVHAKLEMVWSGATIEAVSESGSTRSVGIAASGQNAYTYINGAIFDGTLKESTYAVGIFQHIQTASIYNVLSDPEIIGKPTTLAMFISNKSAIALDNVYSVDPIPVQNSEDFAGIGDNDMVSSALVGAWEINSKQSAEDAIDDVYFTITGKDADGNPIIRPNGTVNNRIVKVTVNNDEKVIYLNNGDTLDKAYFADLYEVSEEAIVVGEVTGGTYENNVLTVSGDTTVAITIDYVAELENVRKNYKLDAKYLTDAAASVWNTFMTAEAADSAAAKAILDTEDALKTALTGGVYTTYPVAQDGKAVPGYKDVELYGAYNTAHVWTINSTEDWLKMVADSVANDFKGYVFHVTDNIDFSTETEPMLPLNYGDKAIKDKAYYPFNGTINGYGNAFKNINVQVTISNAGEQCATGMIGKLGQYAEINNFGVDSGTIHAIGDPDAQPARVYVSTFGEPMNKAGDGSALTDATPSLTEQYAVLNNVWSGATLKAEGAADDANYASGIVAQAQNAYMVINGAFFYGALEGKTLAGITENQSRIYVYNALNDNTGTAPMFVTTLAGVGGMNNVYSTRGNKVENTLTVKPTNTNQNNETGEVPSCTAEEAAWMLNSANVTAAAADGVAKVYFTKVGDAIRFGEESNRIVKVSVNGTEKELYVNNGTTLDKAYFVDLLGVSEAAITAIKVGDSDEPVDSVAAADGLAVTVELDVNGTYQKQLTEKLAEYDLDNLNLEYFKTADEINVNGVTGKIGLKAFVEMATTAIETQTGLAEAVAEIDNVVAEIKGASDYENLPAFKDHALYEEYQPDGDANWLIVDKEDWKKMDEVATAADADADAKYVDTETGKYFEGNTFHLKDNVQFDYAEAKLPLGLRDGRLFSGTIDGHENGFENIFIEVSKTTLTTKYGDSYLSVFSNSSSFGLIGFLGGCEIRNFGINSGWIQASTGNAKQSATTFGCVAPDATSAEDKLILTNVWNNGWLVSSADAGVSGLFGTYSRHNEYAIYADVDGAVIDGTLIQDSAKSYPLVAGLVGGFATKLSVEGLTFSNVIVSADMGFGTFTKGATPAENSCKFGTTCANGTTIEAKHVTMLALNDTAAYNASQFTNVYGIQGGKGDNEKVLSGAVIANTQYKTDQDSVVISGFDALLNTKTEFEAAYEMNTTANDGVYFTLSKDGGIRPTGDATNKIVKVEVTVGDKTETKYINANQPYTNTELRDALGYGVETSITNVEVTSGDGTYTEGVLTVTGDAAITLTVDVCKHTNVTYKYNDGEDTHTGICGDCGYEFETEACTKDWKAGDVDATGASNHKAVCPDCKEEFEESCQGEKVQNVDCMQDDTWAFICGVHAATVVAEGTAEGAHDFENGEGWKDVDGVENKKYRECANEGCEAKEFKLEGTASATALELYCKQDGTITITLPDYLASADLTFSFEGAGYSITHVNGTEWTGGVYAVTAGGEVTVTIAADVTAMGGKFIVAVAEAKDAEDTTIEIPGAEAEITFTSTPGDANGDGDVNLADALKTLYAVTNKDGASVDKDINKANADLHDNGTQYSINVNDVYEIVRKWLQNTLANA